MFADWLSAYYARCRSLFSAPIVLQSFPTITLQGRCVIILCPFIHLYLWSEILFLPPFSHLPNFYSFSKPRSMTISFMTSLLTPQAPLISCEFHDTNIILLLDHLPQYSLQISLSPRIVFMVLGEKTGYSLSVCGYPNITVFVNTWQVLKTSAFII